MAKYIYTIQYDLIILFVKWAMRPMTSFYTTIPTIQEGLKIKTNPCGGDMNKSRHSNIRIEKHKQIKQISSSSRSPKRVLEKKIDRTLTTKWLESRTSVKNLVCRRTPGVILDSGWYLLNKKGFNTLKEFLENTIRNTQIDKKKNQTNQKRCNTSSKQLG